MRPDIVLIHPPYHRRAGSGVTFPLGLGYIAAAARTAGFSVTMIDCAAHFDKLTSNSLADVQAWLSAQLQESKPGLAIGVGPCTTSAVIGLKAIADTCRAVLPSIPVIYGGPLASSLDQRWLFFEELRAAAIVSGDGEFPFVEWLLALSRNECARAIPGIAYPSSSCTEAYIERDLDALPFPARDLGLTNAYRLSIRRDLGAEPFVTLVGSRGCTNRCRFCVSGSLRGGMYARRSFENIGAEVSEVVSRYSARCVVFYDDVLFPFKEDASCDLVRLADQIAEASSKLVWQFEVRPDVACGFDKYALRHAYACGCRQINLGIEKSNNLALRRLGKHALVEQSVEACQHIAKEAPLVRIAGTFILGGPEETRESVTETIDFAVSLPLTFAHFSPLELYPATDLYREVYGGDSRRWYDLIRQDGTGWGEVIFESKLLPKEHLLGLVSEAYDRFYSDPGWRARAERILGDQMSRVVLWAERWRHDRLRLRT